MRPTNPLWYLAGFLFALASAMIATVVAAGAWQPVREATITPVTQVVDARDKTVAVFSDIRQPDRMITCRGRTANKTRIDIPTPSLDLTVDYEGNQWHLIGLLRHGSDRLTIHCTPRDRRIDNASYGFAAVDGYEEKRNNGKGIAVLGGTVGAAFGAYVFYCRRERRKETAHEPA